MGEEPEISRLIHPNVTRPPGGRARICTRVLSSKGSDWGLPCEVGGESGKGFCGAGVLGGQHQQEAVRLRGH